jgi:hypothetical protein
VIDLDLQYLFASQDAALQTNLKKSKHVRALFGLLNRFFELHYRVLSTKGFQGAEKQTVIRHFATDTLSHLVVAARLGLWGALPEGLVVLRGGIESLAQLGFVIVTSKYNTVLREAGRKFEQVEFSAACNGLPELGRELKKLHGKISDKAAHSTATRFTCVTYEFEGKDYDRLGFALSAENAEIVLDSCGLVAIWFGWVLREAYVPDGIDVSWEPELAAMEKKFHRVRKTLLATRK